MSDPSLIELVAGLAAGHYSSEELVGDRLQRIERAQPQLNTFTSVMPERALDAARAADQARAKGSRSPLLGLPIAHKDIFCTRDVRTSCGSRMLEAFVPPYDAAVVERLNAAGAVTLAKTNMDEFAMGSSNENSYFGDVKNPWDVTRVPGGSSGGSAAAVAAGLVPAATGTDTGGSIRQPAAFCGISGIKPTYGRVSRWGMVAFASSLDQGGVFARSAADCALMLESMAGFDRRDSTSVDRPVPRYGEALERPLKGLRIGLPRPYFGEGVNDVIRARIDSAVALYRDLGCTIQEVDLPHSELAVAAYYVVALAECSSNLSRFDGVRYGHRCKNPASLEDLYERSRSEGFGDEVVRRILVGTYALSAGYYDAYYLQAQKVRRLIAGDFEQAFEEVDLLLSPTTPTTAFSLGEKSQDPVSMYLSDVFTVAVSLAGLPAMSIPVGLDAGLPIGMQLIAPHFAETRLLNAAHAFQLASDWHLQRPEAFS